MSRNAIVTAAVLVIILLIVGWYAFMQRSDRSIDGAMGARSSLLPSDVDESFTDMTGQTVTFADHLRSDKIIVVMSWASWCPSCGDQLQVLNDFAATLPEAVTILAVNRQERPNQASRFVQTLGDLPHIEFVLDPTDHFYRDIQGYTIPETVFYNVDGELAKHHRGVLTESVLQGIYNSLE